MSQYHICKECGSKYARNETRNKHGLCPVCVVAVEAVSSPFRYERICPQCGGHFRTNVANKRFCNYACAGEYHRSKPPHQKQCAICGETFYSDQSSAKYCGSACRREAARLRRRTQERSTPTEVTSRFLILQRDDFRCVYCGRSAPEDAAELHIDHIIPRIHGGADIVGNVVTACTQCNLEKGPRDLPETLLVRVQSVVSKRNRVLGWNNNTPVDPSLLSSF